MGRSAGHRGASVLGATVIVIFLKILKNTQKNSNPDLVDLHRGRATMHMSRVNDK